MTNKYLIPNNGDEPLCNASLNETFQAVIDQRLERRDVLKGGFYAAVGSLFAGTALSTTARPAAASGSPLLGFAPVPLSATDSVVVPSGYRVSTILAWGEPITGNHPAYSLDNSGDDQAMQVGSHHDGMHFFPLNGSSSEGLLVMNHEYVEPRFMHRSAIGQEFNAGQYAIADGIRDTDEVVKEINGHGVSVVRVQKQVDGSWQPVRDAHNRRITAGTPMEIAGPVRGSDLVKTLYSPTGERTRGTINNCAHGVTPWNTYLTCEENWAGYFRSGDAELPREHKRYGVRAGRESRYGWELAASGADEFIRFDASASAADATQDYRNEPNAFGWVVEIDPFDPASTPVKRTHLGRFAHEGVIFAQVEEGKPVVCYSGDDSTFEYIYKFVSAQPYHAATAGGHLLDEGTLYVAKFHNDGTGEWLALAPGQNGLTPENGFADLADILVNTRLAADHVGATKMDRPEWGAIDPATGAVYFTLTNNSRREADAVDAANPRPKSEFGHIIRWDEDNGSPASTTFAWNIFVLAGNSDNSQDLSGAALDLDSMFCCPDGLWFDSQSRLWIQTDISEGVMNTGDFEPFGNNQMLAADPTTGEIRRFLVGPMGQEITGVVTTPDRTTMFVNVQHPGATTTPADFAQGKYTSNWPDGGNAYPRSATLVITREDGGPIGG